MKFSGKIGFYMNDVEIRPDVYGPYIVEKRYTGDVKKDRRSFQGDSTKNSEFTINNQITILSDLYAIQNWSSIRYVEWKGTKFKVTAVEVNYPRLILTIGGIWNEEIEREASGYSNPNTYVG